MVFNFSFRYACVCVFFCPPLSLSLLSPSSPSYATILPRCRHRRRRRRADRIAAHGECQRSRSMAKSRDAAAAAKQQPLG
uniref:Putative secreted protein n=1 Tax=Anopheles darlingi TaxID=43151 RepID=A0A2M4DKN6_ANODA